MASSFSREVLINTSPMLPGIVTKSLLPLSSLSRKSSILKGMFCSFSSLAFFLKKSSIFFLGILFEDNTTVTVIENSDLEIDDFIYDPADNTGKLAINVSVGTFRYVSGLMNKDKVAIITPTATITVRGTTLTGVIQQSGVTTVTLLPDARGTIGSASVSNKAGSIDLTKPFHTVTVLSLTVAPPLPSIPSPSALKALGLMVDAVVPEKATTKKGAVPVYF